MAVTREYPTVTSPPPPRRRRWSRGQRFLVVALTLAVVAVFSAAAYLRWTESKITRIAPEDLQALVPVQVADNGIVNFLVVGVDDRSTVPEDWDDNFGAVRGRRADVIMLTHLVPGERIQILSVPRDLKVRIPGKGTNRINAAYVFGGPDLLVQVVQDVTGIPIHHYVEVDFAGVGAIVDALGGVTLDFPEPGRDRKSGFRVDAGRVTLDGEMAVAYARSRHYEALRDGEWVPTPGGDIARTERQQRILLALFDQATSPGNAFDLPRFLPTAAEQITADEGLTLGLMADLARKALTLRSDDLERATLPVRNERGTDGRAYVVPTEAAEAVLRAFREGEPLP